MDLVPNEQFFARLSTTEVAPDTRYAEPRCLVYVPYRSAHRMWDVPGRASAVPSFVSALLAGMDPWSSCYVWPRGGVWAAEDEHSQVGDRVRGVILSGAGVPAGFAGAVKVAAEEADRLVAVVFAYLSFGWNVRDDLFIVPDHARQLLHTDHHDVVHVEFAHDSRVVPFVEHMKAKRYALPDELPDATFKKPDWMQ
jgi:hypothetical protein